MIWLCISMAAFALVFFGRDALQSLLPRTTGRRKAGPAAVESLPGISAAWLLAECGRLAATAAPWPAVAAALNPAADSEVESMLGRLRAAHSGALPAILKAIEEGCRAALADNAEASGFDALSLATRNSQWTSSAKW